MVGGSPLIVKLLEGTQGKGVVLAETKKAAESVINAFKSLNANILVQEFIKEANGWLFKNITSTNPITLCTPVELFIFAWETMLIDLDHICNRAPVRFVGSKFIDYGHHYNMRTKYDISKALLDVAKLIDMEIEFRDDEFTKVQTFITDYSLNLSSRFSDFKAALLALKDSGSKLEINV